MNVKLAIPVVAALALTACANMDRAATSAPTSTLATAALVGADGSSKGTATLVSTGSAVELRLDAMGLPAEELSCSRPTGAIEPVNTYRGPALPNVPLGQ